MQPAITGGPVNKKSRYWKLSGVLFFVFILMLAADVSNDQDFDCGDGQIIENIDDDAIKDGIEDCNNGYDERVMRSEWDGGGGNELDGAGIIGMLSCCGSFVFIILALSARNQQVMYVQRGFTPTVSQPVIPQQIVHSSMPVPRPQVVQPQAPQPVVAAPLTQPRKSSPQDLEKARDFKAAADEYQRLGMYAEAGRVRAMHLEKDQPLVSIGNVGDTILNDSVMVSNEDSTQKKCPSCGKEVDRSFNICPYCKQNL